MSNGRLAALVSLVAMICSGCEFDITVKPDPPPPAPGVPALPVALSNNAAALVESDTAYTLYSFAGLVEGKTWQHVSNRAFAYDSRIGRWAELPPVPGGTGRLAATAQAVAGQVYLFGGYSVAQDGTEVSTPEVFRFEPATRRYRRMPDMPVPVDDTVSAVYQSRYVYLVSGWHDHDNVNNVQLLDTQTDTWLQATPFPGRPVFGHSGGISGDQMVICDGVTVRQPETAGGRRSFAATAACFVGTIDRVDPTRIDWRRLRPHPGSPRYRAAAAGWNGGVIFAGGSANPYNYDGIGYDGVPSAPVNQVVVFDSRTAEWRYGPALEQASMDHRNLLLRGDGSAFVVGGMGPGQVLLERVALLQIKARQ